MAELREAKAAPERKVRKHKRIIIDVADGGGHGVTHTTKEQHEQAFQAHGPEYEEPKHYVFGKGDGEKLLTHLKKHAKIHTAEEEGDTKEHERERKGGEETESEETEADREAAEE